ncbi:hypothetical protein HB943_15810 [Listeria weihenstephanensis]|uniref:Uncharacterized protein n=1 Tax=Listeria weihenstephanensis TaxID=1006155 RepID=A0A841ZA75_9LIST|nr:hypothetical protein [Listeria weihenstephanensis]MBC1502068.1 hypothetical protein [Listeria weihenstephanensis]
MNSRKKSGYVYKFVLAVVLLIGLVIAMQPGVYAKSVPHLEKFDINSITGKRTFVSSVSMAVPNNAYWSYTTTDVVIKGWNYTRYLNTLHYYDSKTKKYYH